MQEPEVVAAVAAGDPSGLTEALDMYAASLFAYCRGLLPEAEAAGAVTDTFVVAREKLAGLRDPSQLGSWLEAVARNECYRRRVGTGVDESDAPARADAGESTGLPGGLAGRILMVCTDETPTGRAHRTTVAHLAGSFGHDGFPKPLGPPKMRRTAQRGRPSRLLIVTGVLAALIVLVGAVIAISRSAGSHPDRVSVAAAPRPQATGGLGGTVPATIPPASAGPTPHATLSATRKPTPQRKPGSPTPPPTSAPPTPVQTQPAAPPPSSPAGRPTTKPTHPAAGVVSMSPGSLSLTSDNDIPDQGIITITASGGSVADYSVSVSSGNGHVLVTPASGSLRSGQREQLLVTAWGKASFDATITISPGTSSITLNVLALKSGAKLDNLQHAQRDPNVTTAAPSIADAATVTPAIADAATVTPAIPDAASVAPAIGAHVLAAQPEPAPTPGTGQENLPRPSLPFAVTWAGSQSLSPVMPVYAPYVALAFTEDPCSAEEKGSEMTPFLP